MKAYSSNPALSPLKTRYEKQSRNPLNPTGHIGIIRIVILLTSPIFLRISRIEGTAEPVQKCALAVAAIFPSAESSCYPRLARATRIAATFPKTGKVAATGLAIFLRISRIEGTAPQPLNLRGLSLCRE